MHWSFHSSTSLHRLISMRSILSLSYRATPISHYGVSSASRSRKSTVAASASPSASPCGPVRSYALLSRFYATVTEEKIPRKSRKSSAATTEEKEVKGRRKKVMEECSAESTSAKAGKSPKRTTNKDNGTVEMVAEAKKTTRKATKKINGDGLVELPLEPGITRIDHLFGISSLFISTFGSVIQVNRRLWATRMRGCTRSPQSPRSSSQRLSTTSNSRTRALVRCSRIR